MTEEEELIETLELMRSWQESGFSSPNKLRRIFSTLKPLAENRIQEIRAEALQAERNLDAWIAEPAKGIPRPRLVAPETLRKCPRCKTVWKEWYPAPEVYGTSRWFCLYCRTTMVEDEN